LEHKKERRRKGKNTFWALPRGHWQKRKITNQNSLFDKSTSFASLNPSLLVSRWFFFPRQEKGWPIWEKTFFLQSTNNIPTVEFAKE
jgi:hypothetical protein